MSFLTPNACKQNIYILSNLLCAGKIVRWKKMFNTIERSIEEGIKHCLSFSLLAYTHLETFGGINDYSHLLQSTHDLRHEDPLSFSICMEKQSISIFVASNSGKWQLYNLQGMAFTSLTSYLMMMFSSLLRKKKS